MKINKQPYFRFFDVNKNEGAGMKTCSSSFTCCPCETCNHVCAALIYFSHGYLSTRSWHGHPVCPPIPSHPDLCVGPCRQTAKTQFSLLVLRTVDTAVKSEKYERLGTHLLLTHVPYPYCMETDYQNLFKYFSSDHYKYQHHIYQ